MQISVHVPYDEQRLRRSLKFVVRPQTKKLRIVGLIMVPAGALMWLTGIDWPMPVLVIVLGLAYAFALEPFMVRQSLRALNPSARQDYELTLDDAGFAVKAESYEQRLAWSTIQRVDEQPDAWFLVITKMQVLPVYKDLMTEEQRALFADILARRAVA
ncbi:YcxB family protein [Actinosynnema sp. NPDC023794]